ncbi:ABC transporter ATP-binding protein [Cohnella rhizosphaerae]|uniref:ABC transporter ATP-binding protein n=1 Tax=Cohnella rhizosphaerae TaxID=1457232 RepID=A0A9X4QVY0_9BACL|nr:ABC transporter ATP-binding protein [Cohnella rhizosphaerae]MDG0813044.1 ABC transporter ATP-binding protein [Cohnella rhizosphaerae]
MQTNLTAGNISAINANPSGTERERETRARQEPPVLSVEHLSKTIRGRKIIDDISFDVRAGEIYGFLGPNGSGKTTTIRMLVDLIKPTSGRVLVCGEDVNKHPERALRHVGCIVENPEMYGYLTGWENLDLFARMQEGIGEARIEEVARIVRLDERIHDKVKTYSLGMRQRLGIAQALLGAPKLLILDEPTNGLDPKGIKELRAFIAELAAEGMSVFVSSHLLSEIQLLCDRVAIIDGGSVIAVGDVGEMIAQAEAHTLWLFENPEAGRRLLADDPRVDVADRDRALLDESVLLALPGAVPTRVRQKDIPDVVARCAAAGVGVLAVQRVVPTLESLFLTLTGGERDGQGS